MLLPAGERRRRATAGGPRALTARPARAPAQFIGELPETTPYDVPPGTWLEKAGYCGQEMHWSVFEYMAITLMPQTYQNNMGNDIIVKCSGGRYSMDRRRRAAIRHGSLARDAH